jgi:hypothetical protein
VTVTPFNSLHINIYGDHFDHTPSSVPRLRIRGGKPPLSYTFLLSGAYVSIGKTLLQTMVVLCGSTNEAAAREPKFSWYVSFSAFAVFKGENDRVVLRRMYV